VAPVFTGAPAGEEAIGVVLAARMYAGRGVQHRSGTRERPGCAAQLTHGPDL